MSKIILPDDVSFRIQLMIFLIHNITYPLHVAINRANLITLTSMKDAEPYRSELHLTDITSQCSQRVRTNMARNRGSSARNCSRAESTQPASSDPSHPREMAETRRLCARSGDWQVAG